MKDREKVLHHMPTAHMQAMQKAINCIITGEISHLDIKSLAGKPGRYRCRIGKYRIIFSRIGATITIQQIGPRGGIYK